MWFLQTMNFRSKTLADLVEAFIGAAFVAGGVEGGLDFLDYHNICKRPPGKPKGTSMMSASNVPRWSATHFFCVPEQIGP